MQALDRVAHGVAWALTFWRRSVQARVVASTVVLSAAVVAGVGWFLMLQTRDGLLEHRVDAVVAEAENETAEARNRLSFVPGATSTPRASSRTSSSRSSRAAPPAGSPSSSRPR